MGQHFLVPFQSTVVFSFVFSSITVTFSGISRIFYLGRNRSRLIIVELDPQVVNY